MTPKAATVAVGQPFAVEITVRNTGRRTSVGTRTRLYLSRDAKADARDLALTTVAAPAIRRRRAHRHSVTVRVPVTFAPGDYRLVACVDAGRRLRERSERNNCRAARAALRVTAVPPAPAPPAPAPASERPAWIDGLWVGNDVVYEPSTPKPTPTPGPPGTATYLYARGCQPKLNLSVEADRASAKPGEVVAYSATIRNEPHGACLGPAAKPNLPGDIGVATTLPEGESVSDIAIWLEVADGTTRTVLPKAAGLTVSGDTAPEACPAGDCSAATQATAGDVDFPDGKELEIAAGGSQYLRYHFYPTLSAEDRDAITAAPFGGVELVAALTLRGGRVMLARRGVTFEQAFTVKDMTLTGWLGRRVVAERRLGGMLRPGEQIEVADAGSYRASAADGESIESVFSVYGESPRAVKFGRYVVSTPVAD